MIGESWWEIKKNNEGGLRFAEKIRHKKKQDVLMKKTKKEANPWVDCRFSIFPIFCTLFCFQSGLKILLITPDGSKLD